MEGAPVGTIFMTASGYVISTLNTTTGQTNSAPTRVLNVHIISGGTAAVVTFKNGSGGNTYLSLTGTASTGATFDFGHHGHTFPSGCYVTFDANTTSVAVEGRADQF
jgi:hypothetical protein